MQAVTNRIRQSQTSKARCPRINEIALRLFMEFHYARRRPIAKLVTSYLDPKMMTARVIPINTNSKLPKTHLV